MRKGAIISECKKYRYSLWRIWDNTKNVVTFICLNPSTADAETDDPTIRRCINYAKAWQYGGLYMVNLFAYRATEPKEMKKSINPIGDDNNFWLNFRKDRSGIIIAGWGNNGNFLGRDKEVKLILKGKLYCLEKSKDGNPKHPLYLKKNLLPISYG